jgi:hypothetical protein
MRTRLLSACVLAGLFVAGTPHTRAAQQIPGPEQFFGFPIGADGELARYPRVLDYFRLIAGESDRVAYERVGETTMGNEYALVTISAPENLARIDRLVEINNRLADPRGMSDAEARQLTIEGRPFYFLYATIHSTEVSNGQAVIEIVHRLASENSTMIRQILDDAVVLIVPSQNPDGQHLVVDHWYETKDTSYGRTYPDLYHKYVGHDDNRDWFMFSQIETRLNVALQNRYKPIITHDMHQQGGNGSRIFVPPFTEPFDANMHPLLRIAQSTAGQAMAAALLAEGKSGVEWGERYDMWTPARQYMVYHGQPRILTEIASSGRLADPFVSPGGGSIGPQESRGNFPVPYAGSRWALRDMVDYGVTAALAGMSHVARYGEEWLYNFYQVHRDWVTFGDGPYAFVVPTAQRDPYATYEMLEILETGAVEIHRATAAFTAGGAQYPEGSWVIKTAQPYGAFAKTMLEKQVYPDLRLFPGGPPEPPYDVTGHTLWMLMGVTVDRIDAPFDATLELVEAVAPVAAAVSDRPAGAYLVDPGSYGVFKMVADLQAADVSVLRAAESFESAGRTFAPGTFIVEPTATAEPIVGSAARDLGLPVHGAPEMPAVAGFRLKPNTKVGLYRGANNMPGGWLMWLLEQYGINHDIVKAQDFESDLNATYDVILLPQGLSRQRIVNGLDMQRNDPAQWGWAAGVGEEGWSALADFVRNGGTLLAIGNAVETARDLLALPIERVLPARQGGRGGGGRGRGTGPGENATQVLRDAFSSPAELMQVLRDRVAQPDNLFYSPGSLLLNEFDTNHPVAWGMPDAWPIFFRNDQAYRLRPDFDIKASVAARYPTDEILQSGWLLGEEYLRDQANVISFDVGDGYVVTYGSQVDFRTQPRATFTLLFNAMFHGPSTPETIR